MTLLRCYRINTLVTEWGWHLIQCFGRICHQNLSFAALVEECVAFNQKVEAVWRMHLHVVPSKQVAHECCVAVASCFLMFLVRRSHRSKSIFFSQRMRGCN